MARSKKETRRLQEIICYSASHCEVELLTADMYDVLAKFGTADQRQHHRLMALRARGNAERFSLTAFEYADRLATPGLAS